MEQAYFKLFNAITDTIIKLRALEVRLQEVQTQAEEIYMGAEEYYIEVGED